METGHIDDDRMALEARGDGTLVVCLRGVWSIDRGLPSASPIERRLDEEPPRAVAFDVEALERWDSTLVAFVARMGAACRARGVPTEESSLPGGLRRLLELAAAVPAQSHEDRQVPVSGLGRIGRTTRRLAARSLEVLDFVGEVTTAFIRTVTFRASVRSRDFWTFVEECGVDALPIVTLISFLVGVILAFVGAVQLEPFGASIYVANLVGVGIARDMGAMMTGIILAGRTGASFAAELGTMKANDEIDALRTMGISPVEMLVVPRMIALTLMMPLLCLYADLVGILGGAFISVSMLDLSLTSYTQQTIDAITLTTVVGGVFKAAVYGMLVALAGCMHGMQCGGSSAAVGQATTRAVVLGIVWIVVACGLFAWLFNLLGI